MVKDKPTRNKAVKSIIDRMDTMTTRLEMLSVYPIPFVELNKHIVNMTNDGITMAKNALDKQLAVQHLNSLDAFFSVYMRLIDLLEKQAETLLYRKDNVPAVVKGTKKEISTRGNDLFIKTMNTYKMIMDNASNEDSRSAVKSLKKEVDTFVNFFETNVGRIGK